MSTTSDQVLRHLVRRRLAVDLTPAADLHQLHAVLGQGPGLVAEDVVDLITPEAPEPGSYFA